MTGAAFELLPDPRGDVIATEEQAARFEERYPLRQGR
jgi:hypothetical protein